MRYLSVGLSGLLAAAIAHAHHSYVEFDDQRTVEIEGTLITAGWRNPHAVLEVQTKDAAGRVTAWQIETSPLNRFRRYGVPLEIFAVGSTVKVAGWPSKRSAARMYGTNLLSADGQELVLWLAEPRWNANAYGLARPPVTAGAPADTGPTLFRVWASAYAIPGQPDDPDASPRSLFRTPLPLTEVASKVRASLDPIDVNTRIGCTPKGMPIVMSQPTPMEFVQQDDAIVLRIEEYDTVRTIHLGDRANAAAERKTALGYSTGRWEGKTLVITTSRVDEHYALTFGMPLGGDAQFVERFTPSDDGSRLHYTLTITDPYMLTMPVELKRSWVARPGEQVLPFNCTE
jgi:hypothetical protein